MAMAKRTPSHLRLVVNRDALFEEPRKYAQSTSGRTSSTGTEPPLSRSRAMAMDSPMRCLMDNAFLKYPMEVPQRRAKLDWVLGSRPLRYSRSDSIPDSLPAGKLVSIPAGKIPDSKGRYPSGMDIDALRTANFLRILREEYGDSPSKLEAKTGYSANMVSQIKTGKKAVKDKLARKLEDLMKLEPMALDQRHAREQQPSKQNAPAWPLSVPLRDFESLSPRARNEIDEAFRRMVIGAQAQELASRPRKFGGS